MKIDTGNHSLTKLRPKWKLVEEAVKEMLEARVIECSKYPVVTFRAIYNITKPLVHQLALINDILALLDKTICFPTHDLRSGYCQVDLDEVDQDKATFM